jgi:hypothetical protein
MIVTNSLAIFLGISREVASLDDPLLDRTYVQSEDC